DRRHILRRLVRLEDNRRGQVSLAAEGRAGRPMMPSRAQQFVFRCRHCGFFSNHREIKMQMTCPVCGKRSQPKELFKIRSNRYREESAEELDPPIVVTDA